MGWAGVCGWLMDPGGWWVGLQAREHLMSTRSTCGSQPTNKGTNRPIVKLHPPTHPQGDPEVGALNAVRASLAALAASSTAYSLPQVRGYGGRGPGGLPK